MVGEVDPDDEEGAMWAVDYVDKIVEEEVARGVDAKRIVVGGFSQGCAVGIGSLVKEAASRKIAACCGVIRVFA